MPSATMNSVCSFRIAKLSSLWSRCRPTSLMPAARARIGNLWAPRRQATSRSSTSHVFTRISGCQEPGPRHVADGAAVSFIGGAPAPPCHAFHLLRLPPERLWHRPRAPAAILLVGGGPYPADHFPLDYFFRSRGFLFPFARPSCRRLRQQRRLVLRLSFWRVRLRLRSRRRCL